MIQLSRIQHLHDRLTAAIRRHGLLTVIKVIAGALVRHGFTATLRLGGAHRPFPWKTGRTESSDTSRRALPADLDEGYGLPAKIWEGWRDIVGASPTDGRKEKWPQLVFVVRDDEAELEAMDRTRAAIQAIPNATLWPETGGGGPRWWVFLRAGDEPVCGMAWAIGAAARGGVAEVVSFDLVRREGERIEPLLFPGANPTLLRSADYLFSRLALADSLMAGVADPKTIEPRELVLAWMEARPAAQVRGRWRHVGRPLVEAAIGPDAIVRQRRDALEASRAPTPRYQGEPITVVICTKDKGQLMRQLVNSLLREDQALVGEVVIVSNNTTNVFALATLEDLSRSGRVKVLQCDEPFNFSKLCNSGARRGDGQGPLLFLNDDITPVSDDWLRRLAVRLHDPDVGSVGALLLYPDERVQHAGAYLGYKGGAGHVLRHARLPDEDYLLTASAAREVSAVTGAVLLTRRSAFEAVNGFDEQLALAFQDIDYGLRLRNTGYVNVFEPASVLLHMESVSVNTLGASPEMRRRRQAERARFLERWGDDLVRNDPLHPRGFDVQDESLRRLAAADGSRPRPG